MVDWLRGTVEGSFGGGDRGKLSVSGLAPVDVPTFCSTAVRFGVVLPACQLTSPQLQLPVVEVPAINWAENHWPQLRWLFVVGPACSIRCGAHGPCTGCQGSKV